MKKIFYFILIYTICLSSQSDTDLIKKMMNVTGTIASLAKVERELQKDILRFYVEAGEEERKLIQEQLDEIYNIDSLIDRYLKYYSSGFNKEKVTEILEEYEYPLFIKATELESRDLEDEEISSYIKNFDPEEISEERMELVTRIKEAARVSEFSYYAARTSIQIAVTVTATFAGQNEPDKNEALVDLILKETEAEMDKHIVMIMLLCYKELSDDELEEYTNFYESPLGKWQTDAAITSHLNTLTESASIFTEAFTEKIKSRKS